MTYHIAYNTHLGNALVALSEQDIVAPEGVTVETRAGDMPDLSRWVWNTALLNFYEKPHHRLTKLEYMNRFTDTELAAIYSAAKVSVLVEVWLAKFNAATPDADGTSVDLRDCRTVQGLQDLEAAGLIGTGRAAEIAEIAE